MKDRRGANHPADPRTYWALERTFLAWLRTGLALMGFGFVVARFGFFLRMFEGKENLTTTAGSGWSMALGTSLVLLGAMVQAGSLLNYWRALSGLKKGEPPQPGISRLGIATAVVLILIGAVMAVYLLVRG